MENVFTGIVACNWLVIFSVFFTMMCTFDPTGRTFVKLKATRRRQRNLTTYTLRYSVLWLTLTNSLINDYKNEFELHCVSFSFRHRLEEGQASSWSRRLKFFMCCTRAKDTQSVGPEHRYNKTDMLVITVSYAHTGTQCSQFKSFFLRMLIRKWPACLPSSFGIWTLCRVTSLLVWCSSDRDKEPKDQPFWIRYKLICRWL